ncbi:spore germination lipoprotein GerD [Halalkalibacter akibai]|uniref:Spore germination protein GerD n=1 Tax=Halalkalibacter akibai (strain ATCC 43226 / DSM 21942 / CIP 109018 / JCM 9157 / 1139) TaxID=1236973 RepID=W4QTF0_HALA3|nr:spore germination lipoprotein GerD [Halalkalibacter akibai]GAE35381.1 spore germination protein GerD [Halalkalibacter akibai JCM 9157]
MKKIFYLFLVTLLLPIVASCAQAESGGGTTPDYESTKKMMVDMLKTDEGKQAIQEIMGDEELQQEIVMDNAFVKTTIQQTLTSEAGRQFWQDVMKDPEFAQTFAESMQTENEKMLKGLMKDPEYQAMMITVLQDPEMEAAMLETMKSKEYRQQVMTIMSDAFESPFFIAKVNEVLEQVAQKQMEKQDQASGGGEGGGEDSGGES